MLIVDDQPANLHVLAEALSGQCQLLFATSGARALSIASTRSIDLVLLDVMLPDLDGFEVCRRLKADPRTRSIPVIFATALGEVDDETRGLDVGGVDYIAKPISPPLVRARVRTHLELHAARKRLARYDESPAENRRVEGELERITRHDLKTPLGTVISLAQALVVDPALSPDQRESLRKIEQSSRRMLKTVDRALELFKPE